MTVDIEKLKALALAADRVAEQMGQWLSLYEIADGITIDALAEFIEALNPAAVLELIAEVERLRAELAAGAAKGGDTIGTLDRWTGHEIMNDSSLACAEFVKLEDARRAAPAAGTVEKDAARLVTRVDDFGTAWLVTLEQAEVIDAAIEAHNTAGKTDT